MTQRRSPQQELNEWLDSHSYRRSGALKTKHPYTPSSRMLGHARKIHQEPTGREVFAAHERDHHITTSGRRALSRDQFALPPGPEEKRRGIKGRLPIDTLKRARNALTRASMMHHQKHLTATELAGVRRTVHKAWPEIEITVAHSTKNSTQLDPRRASLGPGPRSESERKIHPEMFAAMDRHGKILGTSRSVKGAMGYAPPDKTYVSVRGEFTSDGTSHGVGRGRVVATREFHPSGGFRWYVESYSPL